MAHTNRIEVSPVTNRRDLKAFVRFPWEVYRGDRNWVPPLISERKDRLNPQKNPFLSSAGVELFLARRNGRPVGTIAAFADRESNERLGEKMGGFGFFEALEEYEVARALLDAACERVRRLGMEGIRGPTNFTVNDEPGVLVSGADCPPAILEAHTRPYYPAFLEKYGMVKYADNYAWRVDLKAVGGNLQGIPQQVMHVFESAASRGDIIIRKARMADWDSEVVLAREMFNSTLQDFPGFVPVSEQDFQRLADNLRFLVDPDMVLFAEIGGRTVGFLVCVPDINCVLRRLNGRLFPLGWLKLVWYVRRIEVISFKLFGVLQEYRRRGIDALLYMQALKSAIAKGYRWLDGSLTSDMNPTVVRLAERLGAERYKHYRVYQMVF